MSLLPLFKSDNLPMFIDIFIDNRIEFIHNNKNIMGHYKESSNRF